MNNIIYDVRFKQFEDSVKVIKTSTKENVGIEELDVEIPMIINKLELDDLLIITADHGNCEQMINDDGTINTAHTTNLVPFIIVDKNIKNCF